MAKLMTKTVEKSLPRLYATDGQGKKAIARVHYFNSSWDWYGTEYDPETGDFFGLVKGFATEQGYFSLKEFEEFNRNSSPLNQIERDLYFAPCALEELI